MSWNSSSTASMQLQMVSKAKRKLLFFQSRIGNAHVYIYIEISIDMFHAFMAEDVLEQLVSSFNAALDGICG